ncbi:hypothetical protein HY622_03055 [Candidatus Uhrbacteria bacterium]|nr:hypothetical protein [Candidatus Uhrbacteria bacterium]
MNVITEEAIAREFPRNTRVVIKERYTDHSQQRSLRSFTIGYTTGKVGLYCRLQGYSVRVGRGPEIITGDGTLMAVPTDCLKRDEEEK